MSDFQGFLLAGVIALGFGTLAESVQVLLLSMALFACALIASILEIRK